MSDERECPGLTWVEWVLLIAGVLALVASVLVSQAPDEEDPGTVVEVEIRRSE